MLIFGFELQKFPSTIKPSIEKGLLDNERIFKIDQLHRYTPSQFLSFVCFSVKSIKQWKKIEEYFSYAYLKIANFLDN